MREPALTPKTLRRNRYPIRRRPPVRLRYLFLLLLGILLLLVSRPSDRRLEARPAPEPATVPEYVRPPAPQTVVREFTVRRGDTLIGILGNMGVPEPAIASIAGARPEGVNLSRLMAGRPYRALLSGEKLVEYQYEPDDLHVVRVDLRQPEPVVTFDPIPFTVQVARVSGRVDGSLFAAVEDLGEGASLAMTLADIFAWQIDFFRDLRAGDAFTVLVEKIFRDGSFVRYGDVLAARFINGGQTFHAVLHKTRSGSADYYDEEGGSLRKQFLKTPLKFRRISSGFSSRRLHPVTGRVAPHLGVDYAAPVGTPVRAVGDGRIVVKKTDSVNGRFIKIRHNSVYSSAYAHLNSFASGISAGTVVKQGQIIGYVGQSGRATGPHLHFVMYRNDRYCDPGKISVPRASSVPASEMEDFVAAAGKMMAEMDSVGPAGGTQGYALR